MICYRDATFYKDCKRASTCPRPLTPEVQKAADEWWKTWNVPNEEAPICVYSKKPPCHEVE